MQPTVPHKTAHLREGETVQLYMKHLSMQTTCSSMLQRKTELRYNIIIHVLDTSIVLEYCVVSVHMQPWQHECPQIVINNLSVVCDCGFACVQ